MGGGKRSGGSGQAAAPPPPPAAPPPPPTQVDASRQVASTSTRRTPRGPANVRNEGGARGFETASTARALKTLTGQ